MYVKYTEEQKQAARNADLLDYMRRRGYTVVQHGPHEHMLKEHDSIKISNNLWCRFSKQEVNTQSGEVNYEGGNTLDFAMKIEGLSFTEAMKSIVGEMNYGLNTYRYDYEAPKQTEKEKNVQLPEANGECRHVFAYLCKTRCIDEDIVKSMVKDKLLYESKEHHNCVFISRDESGAARYAFIRGTNSEKKFAKEAAGSTKAFGLTMKGTGDTVYVFEAVIDAMSHATLTKHDGGDWHKDWRVSLGGVSPLALNHLLSKNDNIKNVVICTDNDEAGIEASRSIMRSLEGKGYNVSIDRSKQKDWNEDLKRIMNRSKCIERAS